jgi:HSP20 family protein
MTEQAMEKSSERNPTVEKRAKAVATPETLDGAVGYTPRVDIVENSEGFVFHIDLPGVKAEDVDVRFENGVLIIKGKVTRREPEHQNLVWREYGVGNFYRSFNIDAPIQADAIKAELHHGELKLTVPKIQAARTRKIEVQAA